MNFYFLHESIIKQRRTSKTQEQIRPNYPPPLMPTWGMGRQANRDFG